jgi:hypothetical protein
MSRNSGRELYDLLTDWQWFLNEILMETYDLVLRLFFPEAC